MSLDDAEERIMLGGKVSAKHEVFKQIAMMDKETAFVYLFLKKLKTIQETSKDNPIDAALTILELDGQVNFMDRCTELTKLSAILGDTRQKYSQKDLKEDVARKLRESP